MGQPDKIAIVGAGLIGRAWAIVFARAGMEVTLWDQFPQQTTYAMTFIADRLLSRTLRAPRRVGWRREQMWCQTARPITNAAPTS